MPRASGRLHSVIGACLLALLMGAHSTAAPDAASPPALLEVFDEGLPAGASWESPSADGVFRDVRDEGGYAGQRWAYMRTRDRQISIKGFTLPIRETPGPGEYRYLSFAVRKWGGGQLAVQIDQNPTVTSAGEPGESVGYRYDLGKGPPVDGKALRVGEIPSDAWIEVTRDLWKDFGDLTLTGLTLISLDGRDAGLDRVYLARSTADLKAMIPSLRDRAQVEDPVADVAPPAFRAAPAGMLPRNTAESPAYANPTAAAATTTAASYTAPSSTPASRSLPAAASEPAPAEPASHTLSWGQKLKEAGPTGAVQLALSIFGGIFVFERLFGLRKRYLVPDGLAAHARSLWAQGKFDELERLKETHPSTLGRVISFIAANRTASLSEVSAIAGELVSRELDIHHRKAYPLGVVATLAPLLGLLGMILGMIETFEIVATAGSLGDPTQLASGISEALVTTGLGLAIAIPFLTFYHVAKHRTSGFGVQLEEQVTSLMTLWLLKRKTGEE